MSTSASGLTMKLHSFGGRGKWILVFRQDGRFEVLRPADDGYRPVRTYDLAEAQVWAHPALWDRHILVKDTSAITLWRVPSAESVRAPSG
jgi:hypothetical protein